MSSTIPILLLSFVLFFLPMGTAEGTNYPLAQQNPTTSTPAFGVFTSPFDLGWEFTVAGSGVLVTHLGCNVPQNDARVASLWTTSGTLLGRVNISAGSGWRFVALSTPVALTQGTNYIVSECGTGYYHTFTVPSSWMGDSNITYVQGRYISGSTPTFPSTTQASQMGCVDIGYSTGPAAPAWITYPGTSSGGNYTVSWATTTGTGTVTYDLEEDTTASFTSPTNVYSGTATTFNVTNHPPGTFYYRVRGRDTQGPGAWCTGGAIVITIPPPSPPSMIIVPTSSATGSYVVSWTASTGATQYELQEANNSTFAGATQVYLGSNLTFNVTGKTGGTWWYQVRAANAGGSSAWTQSTNGCTITVPNPPSSITVPATSATGNYTITWSAVTGATGYFLQEDTNASFTTANTIYNGTNLTHNVTGKTSGTYYYRVCAYNSVGNSTWTNGANGCQIVPPNPPPSITVPTSSVDGNFTVTWTASPSGASSYDLEEDTSSAFTSATSVYSGSNLTFNVTGKTSGTWWYRVRAQGVAGSSTWTASTNGCQILPPAAPASITVPTQSSTGSYTVTWASSTGATSYDLEEDTSASFTGATVVYSGSNTSYNVSGKTSGTFYYRVRAVNGAGASGWTQGANGCQIVPPNPPTPLNVPATSSTGTFQVTWGSSGSGVAYELQEDTTSAFTGATTVYTGSSLLFTLMGKMNGTYYYRIRASNGAGPSGWTTDMTGCTVTLVPPSAPATVTVPATSSTGNYVVSWTSVTGAWAYDLEESTTPAFSTPTLLYTGSTTSYSVTGNSNGTYYYRVRASNGAGQSGWTPGGNGCTVNQMAPPAPGFLTVPANSTTGNFQVDWGVVTGASLYELEEATASDYSGAVQIFRGSASSFQVTGRTSGTYYYRVRSVNVVGTSGWTPGSNPCVVSLTQPAAHVEAGPGNPGPTPEMPGALGVPMLHVRILAGAAEDIQVLSMRLMTTGSGDDSTEISSVRLIRDVNGDGLEGVGDVQVGNGSFGADEGFIDFDLSTTPPIPGGGMMHYLAVCDFSATAFTGSAFSFSVAIPSGLNCQGAVSLTGVTPSGVTVFGGVKTMATSGVGSLSVGLGGNSPEAGEYGFPRSGLPLLQLRLSASSLEGVNVTGMKFASGGTGDESVGITARLVRDNDNDGQDSSGDVTLASGAFSGDNGTLEFTSLSLNVPSNDSVMLLVVYDFGTGTFPGTYGVTLEVGQDVEATGDASSMGITAGGAPVAGALLTLVPGSAGSSEGAVYFMGGCGASVVPSPTGWAGLLLLLAAAGLAFFTLRRRRFVDNSRRACENQIDCRDTCSRGGSPIS